MAEREAQVRQLRMMIGFGVPDEALRRVLAATNGKVEVAARMFFEVNRDELSQQPLAPSKHGNVAPESTPSIAIVTPEKTAASMEVIDITDSPPRSNGDSTPRGSASSTTTSTSASAPLVPASVLTRPLLYNSPLAEWPKPLPSLQLQITSTTRGDYPTLMSAPLTVWHERPGVQSAASKGVLKRKRAGSLRRALEGEINGYEAETASELNVRVGFPAAQGGAAPSSIGRLPAHVAKCMAPLLDAGLVRAAAHAVYCTSGKKLHVGANILIQLTVQLHKAAKPFMRFTRVNCDSGGSSKAPAVVVTPQHARLKSALFELIYVAVHGDSPPKPQIRVKAPASDSSCAAKAASAASAASEDALAEDNTEERIDETQAVTLYEAETAPNLPVVPQPAVLRNITLRPYQQQALAWMLARELETTPTGIADSYAGADRATSSSWPGVGGGEASPLDSLVRDAVRGRGRDGSLLGAASMWEQHEFHDDARTPLFLNPFTRTVSLAPPPANKPCRGGIVADEMGLGKTLEMVALVVAQMDRERSRAIDLLTGDGNGRSQGADAEDGPPADAPDDEELLPRCRATLVVCPMSMVGQWTREIVKYTVTARNDASAPARAPFGGSALRVGTYYGGGRIRDPSQFHGYDVIVTSYGMVASEFYESAKASEAGPGSPQPNAPIFAVKWERIALDEAHTIKNRSTRVARACHAIAAKYRWCLTGTPVQNSLQDLYSLLRFLRHEPWSEPLWWTRVISDPYERGDPRAIATLHAVLRPLLLRRTKVMTDVDGRKIGDLKPADIRIVYLDLDADERTFYEQLYNRSKLKFQGYVATGRVLSKYAQILSLLLRLRQACDHPFLVLGSTTVARVQHVSHAADGGAQDNDDEEEEEHAAAAGDEDRMFTQEFMRNLYDSYVCRAASRSNDLAQPQRQHSFVLSQLDALAKSGTKEQECPVCFEDLTPGHAALLVCGHLMCPACLAACASQRKECPLCKAGLEGAQDAFALQEPKQRRVERSSVSADWGHQMLSRKDLLDPTSRSVPWRSSTKLDYLVSELAAIRSHNERARTSSGVQAPLTSLEEDMSAQVVCDMVVDGPVKVVVFSYFTFMLDLIQRCLTEHRTGFVRLDGTMSQSARETALRSFRSDPKTFVFLISLKAGGLGLNLTEASIVYLVDPWWNPSVEYQALSRVHRLGQQQSVYIKRLIVRETVEMEMLAIQERKQQLADSALAAGSTGSANKLTEQDLMLFFRR